MVKLQAEAQAAADRRAAVDERVERLTEEREGLRASLEDVRTRLGEVRGRLEAMAEEGMRAEEALTAAQAERTAGEAAVHAARERLDQANQQAAGLRTERAGLDARRTAAQREVETAAERRVAATTRLAELSALRDEAVAGRQESHAELDRVGELRQEAARKHDEARAHLQEVREARDALVAHLRKAELERDKVRSDLLHHESRQRDTLQSLEQLEGRIEERYQIDLFSALRKLQQSGTFRVSPSPEAADGLEVEGKVIEPVEDLVITPELLEDEDTILEAVARVEEDRGALQRLGEVNLTALEEYTELAERYRELDTQKLDLEESVETIREAIAKLNETCRERFRDAFDRVDAAFRQGYPELVGGGEARLQLTDEEDLLETGVEIFVRPPGKRLQNLTLLSGGEKAMTAIALLLALFTVKPSPFCVLDEVDAPLDEANGARFNDMIRKMSTMTQFIVITHNPKTMECADVSYGVTMPKPGCSQIFAQRIP